MIYFKIIRFDHSLSHKKLTTLDILRDKAGTRRDFVTIFTEMCEVGGIKFKTITGFIKDDNYHPGMATTGYISVSFSRHSDISGDRFDKRKSPLESWVAVFVENDWRLVDPLLGAGKGISWCGVWCLMLTLCCRRVQPGDRGVHPSCD